MATFRIHEDQENRANVQFRQKGSNMAPPKRSVLGVIDSTLNSQNQLKGKRPLEPANKISDETLKVVKPVGTKLPMPAVPVAQFEAFKVYEDVKENKVPIHRKIVKPKIKKSNEELVSETTVLYDEQIIKEVSNSEVKSRDTILKELNESLEANSEEIIPETPEGSPMSVEKSIIIGGNKTYENDLSTILSHRSEKDRIFEIEEYRPDIYLYLREHELRNRPKPGYMRKQPDITYNMRTILVDWLVEVAQEYKLHSETLYLCINYIDRFLSYMSVVRSKLQLVGTAAMFIAAKYEEIYPPEVGEFVYITDDTYTKKQLLRMEQLILKVLSFDLSIPTPLTFVTAICMSSNMPVKVMNLGMYLCELSMLETDTYIETRPSVLASSAIAVARFILKLQPWVRDLKVQTGYEENDLKRTMEFLYVLFCKASSLAQQAVQEKYNCSKYMYVSQLRPHDDVNIP